MLEVFRLECRSDDTFLDGVMQARLCVRLRSLRFFKGGVGSGDSVARLRNSYWVASECLWDYEKPIFLVHRQPDSRWMDALGFWEGNKNNNGEKKG